MSGLGLLVMPGAAALGAAGSRAATGPSGASIDTSGDGAGSISRWPTTHAAAAPATNNDGTSLGFEVGAGMYMDDDNELYGRWQWLSPGIASNRLDSSKLNIATIGWNHYIAGPNTKLSVDWNWCFSDPSFANALGGGAFGYTGWWTNNLQSSGSQWLLRTQLQISF
jgi:hypothetical protein